VGKLSAMGHTTRPTQPSIPLGSVTWTDARISGARREGGGVDHYTADWGCMDAVSKVCVCGYELQPRLNAGSCLQCR